MGKDIKPKWISCGLVLWSCALSLLGGLVGSGIGWELAQDLRAAGRRAAPTSSLFGAAPWELFTVLAILILGPISSTLSGALTSLLVTATYFKYVKPRFLSHIAISRKAELWNVSAVAVVVGALVAAVAGYASVFVAIWFNWPTRPWVYGTR
jgi:hypothetical protein